jgi:hypothetical protein
MLNNAGQVILFVTHLAGLGVVTPFFLIYLGRTYYVVLSYSSTGEDRFRWPRDGFTDWYRDAAPVILAFIAVGGLAAILGLPLFWQFDEGWGLAGWFLLVWLAYPIALSSMLTAPTWLLLIYPPLIGRLLVHARGLFYVYVLTLPFGVAIAVGIVFLLQVHGWAVLFLAAVVPPALLLHARAWGRLVWLALNYDLPKRRKKKRRPKLQKVETPEELPVAVELEELPAEEGAYDLLGEEVYATGPQFSLADHYAKERAAERERRRRAGDPQVDPLRPPDPPTPRVALGSRIPAFLFYEETLTVWFAMSLATLVETGLVLGMARLWFG